MAAVTGDEDVRLGGVGRVLVFEYNQRVALAFDDEVVGQFFERSCSWRLGLSRGGGGRLRREGDLVEGECEDGAEC